MYEQACQYFMIISESRVVIMRPLMAKSGLKLTLVRLKHVFVLCISVLSVFFFVAIETLGSLDDSSTI